MTKHEEAFNAFKRFRKTLSWYVSNVSFFKRFFMTWKLWRYIHKHGYIIQMLIIESVMEHNSEMRELLQAKMKQTKDIQELCKLFTAMNNFIHSYRVSPTNYQIWKKYMDEVNEITGKYKNQEEAK